MARTKKELIEEAHQLGIEAPEEYKYHDLRGVVADARKEAEDAAYTLIVETGGEKYEVKTDDIAQAVIDLDIEYTNTKTYFAAVKGDRRAEWRCNVPQSRRIFRNPIGAAAVANRLKTQLR